MKYQILGPLSVSNDDGSPVRIPGSNARTVLAVLLLHNNTPVPVATLADALWQGTPPASHAANLQSYVSRLRQVLPPGTIEHVDRSYRIRLNPTDLDLVAFRAAGRTARRYAAAGDFLVAARRFRAALTMWRGRPLDGLPVPLLAAQLSALEEDRLVFTEDCLAAELAVGRGPELISELQELVEANPLRERLRGHLMLALARSGRPTEALDTYTTGRAALVRALGVEPGPELQRLHVQVLRGELGEATAPANTSDAFPVCQLPPDATDFTGRERAVRRGTRLLTAGGTAVPVVVVSGTPGVGKTALAVHLAHQVRDTFPDGQLFVRLAGSSAEPRDPNAVLGELLQLLGVPGPAIPNGTEARASAYRARLADRQLLVVLDDAHSPGQVRPLLPGTAGGAVLVTSRNRLSGLAAAGSGLLEPLTTAEGVAMLSTVVGARRVAAEHDAAQRIVRFCGRVPMALGIAAARLARRPDWSLAHLADRLGDERRRLDELSVDDLQIRATLAPSYEGLCDFDRRALRLLAAHSSGDFAAWTLAALLDVHDAEAVLDRLVDANLVDAIGSDAAGQLRYRLPDLIKVYGRERCLAEDSEADRAAALRRMILAGTQLADLANRLAATNPTSPWEPGGTPVSGLSRWLVRPALEHGSAWLDAEYPALVAAACAACRSGRLDDGARLATRLTGYLWSTGRTAELRTLHGAVHRAAVAAGAERTALESWYLLEQTHAPDDFGA
ncbi:MAG: BTAD domain-containing putative transcriptional regulator [Actinocatenispora sp.]